jgi:hypothetical protein
MRSRLPESRLQPVVPHLPVRRLENQRAVSIRIVKTLMGRYHGYERYEPRKISLHFN